MCCVRILVSTCPDPGRIYNSIRWLWWSPASTLTSFTGSSLRVTVDLRVSLCITADARLWLVLMPGSWLSQMSGSALSCAGQRQTEGRVLPAAGRGHSPHCSPRPGPPARTTRRGVTSHHMSQTSSHFSQQNAKIMSIFSLLLRYFCTPYSYDDDGLPPTGDGPGVARAHAPQLHNLSRAPASTSRVSLVQ